MKTSEYFKIGFKNVKDDEKDYRLLASWYQNPEIYKYLTKKRLNIWDVQDLYKEAVKVNGRHRALFFMYNEEILGVIKYKLFNQHANGFLGIDEELIYEMKVILKDPSEKNIKAMTMALELACYNLEEKNGIDRVLMFPMKDNKAVIKGAKKAGFRKRGTFEDNGSEYLILEYNKMYFANNDPTKKIVI